MENSTSEYPLISSLVVSATKTETVEDIVCLLGKDVVKLSPEALKVIKGSVLKHNNFGNAWPLVKQRAYVALYFQE